jgi:uroporphyrin-3 C-methyltransferase
MDATQEKGNARRRIVMIALLAALVALVGLSWLDSRNRIVATQEELARRLRDMETDSRDARSIARQAQETTRELAGKLTVLESRVAESQSQQVALEALYQELSRRRDEWQLAEIEQVLAIASQQLQLSGNVRAALLALQLAEARLARADRPQFLPVRRALARDIERLKSLPALDLAGMSLRVDGVVAAVDGLPLAHEDRAAKPAPPKDVDKPADSFLSRFGSELWSELRQLVTIRRVETPEPPLLLPAHAYFLRENLKLRLLSARVSLLTRDEAGYREDLRVSQQWVRKYFDVRTKPVQAALGQLKQLSAASISLEMPSISESLDAVRNFKAPRERRPG